MRGVVDAPVQGCSLPPGTATYSPIEAEFRLGRRRGQGSQRADTPFAATAACLDIMNVSQIRTDFCHVPQTGQLELLFLILCSLLFY